MNEQIHGFLNHCICVCFYRRQDDNTIINDIPVVVRKELVATETAEIEIIKNDQRSVIHSLKIWSPNIGQLCFTNRHQALKI